MVTIKDITARQIFDSRGNPTVEADLLLSNNCLGRAAVPSGASTGRYEALELRDGGVEYLGRGMKNAIQNILKEIRPQLLGKELQNQAWLDETLIELDGTPNKERLGANAILGVSMAACRALAASSGSPLYQYLGGVNANQLPVPMMNIINGGVHADNNLDFQEFMIMPNGATTFTEAMRIGTEVFHHLKKILHERGLSTAVGDEGGFAPNLQSHVQAIGLILEAVELAGYTPEEHVTICLDIASTELYDENKNLYLLESGKKQYKADDLIELYADLIDRYPILSIEDGLAEDDWNGWKKMTEALGAKVQLVGDDLFVTSKERLHKGIGYGVANSILIKLNQIGTVTETLETMTMAAKNHYSTVVSHRSGETEDTFIADLAVATNAGQIKTGSMCRSDRMAKYNQLLRIEEDLGGHARY